MEVYSIDNLTDALDQRAKDVNNVIRKKEYLEEFRNLWKNDSYYGDYYDLYCKVRNDMGMEPRSISDFDYLFSVYNPRAVKFEDALSEWAELTVDAVYKN